MTSGEKAGRRKFIAGLPILGAPLVWSKPIVNTIVLPAHAITSVARIPTQLEGIWLARYVNRSASFRLTINSDGSAVFFQQILTFGGIPINRIDVLELESVTAERREIRWSSARTEIIVTYNEALDFLEGTEQPVGRTPAAFTASLI